MKVTINIDMRSKYPLGWEFINAQQQVMRLKHGIRELEKIQQENWDCKRQDKIRAMFTEQWSKEKLVSDIIATFPEDAVHKLYMKCTLQAYFYCKYLEDLKYSEHYIKDRMAERDI